AAVGKHFEPMLADVGLAAAMMAWSGLAPRFQHACDLNRLTLPAELPGKSRFARAHAGRIECSRDRLNRSADELLGHINLSSQLYSGDKLPRDLPWIRAAAV